MPFPEKILVTKGRLPLQGPIETHWKGPHDAHLQVAVQRFEADVLQRTGLAPRGKGPLLVIDAGGDVSPLAAADTQESYTLEIDGEGIRLAARRSVGVLRGLATLRQLIDAGSDGFSFPCLKIEDSPRFAWRGLMIDVARHFISLPTLKRQLDAMERVKLNVLHLHLSDSEAFRVESKRYPRLTEVSARGGYFTQDQIRELVAYAADRGIRVVPEIDVPGHTGAILVAYPELSASPVNGADPIALRSVALDPSKPATYDFIQGLYTEMAALFPDAYFHVGGDEVPQAAWTGNAGIQAFMAAQQLPDRKALQRYFFQRVKRVLDGLGKTTMGWEEVAAGPIDDSVLVQAWRSSQATAHITAQHNRAVVSAGYYLDLLWPGAKHYAIDPIDPLATPPDRPTDVIGPRPEGPLSAEQATLVIGAEAPMWTEVITDEMVDGRIWPRAALLAERFWSAATVKDPVDASRRLVAVQEGLRLGGLADEAHRHAMSARLSPDDAAAVELLASATAPIRNFGRLWEVIAAARSGKPLRLPELNTLADTAAPDSVEMLRLSMQVERYLAGERTDVQALQAMLASYRDNDARFVAAARGRPLLEKALPISADVAALAQAGLDAVAMLQHGTKPGAAWRQQVTGLLQRQTEAASASSSIPKVWTGAAQPPANLLIRLAPIVERLARAAGL